MAYIEINHLTKDYGSGRGVFDVTMNVEQGEIYGFVGVNGAGKTTTIRHVMGFLTPDAGSVTIKGMDARQNAAEIKRYVSYIPGEINFPGNTSGEQFIRDQIYLAGQGEFAYAEKLKNMLQLDWTANIHAMSKGMKQKTAIIAALCLDADILIMDEPTTGLDPLMRDIFIDLLKEEKAKGKTIFMSSHIFQEVEEICDRVAVIQDGKIIEIIDMKQIRYNQNKSYKMEFKTQEDYDRFMSLDYEHERIQGNDLQVTVAIHDTDINRLIQDIQHFDLVYFKEIKTSFEDYLSHIFKED